MPIVIEKSEDKEFELIPPGQYYARLCRIAQLGTQKVSYEGKEKLQKQVQLRWECPAAVDAEGRTFIIQKKYTESLSTRSTLFEHLSSWLGNSFIQNTDSFVMDDILGQWCILNVDHTVGKDKNTYVEIKAIIPVMPGSALPVPTRPLEILDLTPGYFNQEIFEGLSERLREMIKASPEYQQLVNGVSQSAPAPQQGVPAHLQDTAPHPAQLAAQRPQQQGVFQQPNVPTAFDESELTEDDIPF